MAGLLGAGAKVFRAARGGGAPTAIRRGTGAVADIPGAPPTRPTTTPTRPTTTPDAPAAGPTRPVTSAMTQDWLQLRLDHKQQE